MLTEDEVNRADAVFYGTDGTIVERWRAVFAWFTEVLAARGGTMTAEQVHRVTDAMRTGGHGDLADALDEHISALGARVAVLEEKLAEREGASILDKNAIRLQRERADAALSELAEARATIARLTATGQALSGHADRTAGESLAIPDPCICGGDEHHIFHCPARNP